MSAGTPAGLTAFAPAKINLTLRAGAPRADGYHPVQSLVVFADWGDTLQANPAPGLSLRIEGPHAAALADDQHNLVLKAAWALRAAAERPDLGASLVLYKQLPVASGIGGGSADAAAALRILNSLWDLGFSTRALAEIGSVVGADVPACVWSRPLLMEGIGEEIRVLAAWPELAALIVNPGKAVATPDVFRAFDAAGGQPRITPLDRLPVAGDAPSAFALLKDGRNDLEAPARSLAPVIGEVLEALDAAGNARLVRMSGSGASCFALYDSFELAQEAGARLGASRPHWITRPVRLGGAA